jgi:hypothetical protein
MLATLIVSVIAFTLMYAWMLVVRYSIERERQERILRDLA